MRTLKQFETRVALWSFKEDEGSTVLTNADDDHRTDRILAAYQMSRSCAVSADKPWLVVGNSYWIGLLLSGQPIPLCDERLSAWLRYSHGRSGRGVSPQPVHSIGLAGWPSAKQSMDWALRGRRRRDAGAPKWDPSRTRGGRAPDAAPPSFSTVTTAGEKHDWEATRVVRLCTPYYRKVPDYCVEPGLVGRGFAASIAWGIPPSS